MSFFGLANKADNTNCEIMTEAFEGISANVMILDKDFNIIYTNNAVRKFLQKQEKFIQGDLPNVALEELIGKNLDIFHKDLSMQGTLSAYLNGPYATSIRLGGAVFNIRICPILDKAQQRMGFVVEWTELEAMSNISPRTTRDRLKRPHL